MTRAFDAIRGRAPRRSPTAMLLARKGYRVLVVDRATFPSDTVSTHILHPLGARALSKWGLLDRLAATGCPPIHTYAFDPLRSGARPAGRRPGAPRRTILDKLLVVQLSRAGPRETPSRKS
jgi:2-polyprenyl-6-methoxyphenol hydroxylase-like FAD-dependent oxidoreductase